LGEDI
jgi:hypothetical protein